MMTVSDNLRLQNGTQLTRRLLTQITNELVRALFYQLVHLIATIAHRITFQTKHLELIEKPNLVRQPVQMILEQQQLLQIGKHTNLGWKFG